MNAAPAPLHLIDEVYLALDEARAAYMAAGDLALKYVPSVDIPGRYSVLVDGFSLGWVSKITGGWSGYLIGRGVMGRRIAVGARTRKEAAADVVLAAYHDRYEVATILEARRLDAERYEQLLAEVGA